MPVASSLRDWKRWLKIGVTGMNADVEVSMWEDDDSERAKIRIRSLGGISELRFRNFQLNGVANFSSLDVRRLLESIREAERKRIDPDPKTLSSLEYVMDRIDYLDEDKTRLYLNIEAEMPLASCGSVMLQPNLDAELPPDALSDSEK